MWSIVASTSNSAAQKTVGDNECVGANQIYFDWKVLGIIWAWDCQYEAFQTPLCKSLKENFCLPTPAEEWVAVL